VSKVEALVESPTDSEGDLLISIGQPPERSKLMDLNLARVGELEIRLPAGRTENTRHALVPPG